MKIASDDPVYLYKVYYIGCAEKRQGESGQKLRGKVYVKCGRYLLPLYRPCAILALEKRKEGDTSNDQQSNLCRPGRHDLC